jgi:hypothetical protein
VGSGSFLKNVKYFLRVQELNNEFFLTDYKRKTYCNSYLVCDNYNMFFKQKVNVYDFLELIEPSWKISQKFEKNYYLGAYDRF